MTSHVGETGTAAGRPSSAALARRLLPTRPTAGLSYVGRAYDVGLPEQRRKSQEATAADSSWTSKRESHHPVAPDIPGKLRGKASLKDKARSSSSSNSSNNNNKTRQTTLLAAVGPLALDCEEQWQLALKSGWRTALHATRDDIQKGHGFTFPLGTSDNFGSDSDGCASATEDLAAMVPLHLKKDGSSFPDHPVATTTNVEEQQHTTARIASLHNMAASLTDTLRLQRRRPTASRASTPSSDDDPCLSHGDAASVNPSPATTVSVLRNSPEPERCEMSPHFLTEAGPRSESNEEKSGSIFDSLTQAAESTSEAIRQTAHCAK